ncbi:RHS repeat domain-containing protein [Colwellia sp. E150_009]
MSSLHKNLKQLLVVITAVLLFSLTSQKAYSDTYTDTGIGIGGTGLSADQQEQQKTLIKDYISDFPNEYIDLQALKLKLEYNDVFIPGNNGMDIIIKRIQDGFSGGGFSLDYSTGYIATETYLPGTLGAEKYPTTDFECLGSVHKVKYRKRGRNVKPFGYANAADLPEGALVAFDDKSILVCEGTPELPTLIFPDGRKHIYSLTGGIIEINDRFGNYIRYSERINNVRTITRSDGQTVSLNYETVGNSIRLSSITYSGKTLEYKYKANGYFEKFIDAEGRETSYEFLMYTGGVGLSSVTMPTGLKVVYDLNPLLEDLNSKNVAFKTISGPGIQTRVFGYALYPEGRTLVTEYDYTLNKDFITEYYIYRSFSKMGKIKSVAGYLGPKINGLAVQRGDFRAHTKVFSENYTWDERRLGDYGCEIHANPPYYGYVGVTSRPLCSEMLMLSKVTSLMNTDGTYTTYTTNFTEYNQYGELTKYNETQGSNTRYTKYEFDHDVTNWVLNLPTTTQISTSDANYTTVNETTYHSDSVGSADYATLSLPYEEKAFGIWQKRYNEYHTDGTVKKIEYNQKIPHGDTAANRYKTFTSYKRGQAQTITHPKRYLTGTMNATQSVDNNGWVTQTKDLNGNVVNRGYDEIGRLKYVDPVDVKWADTLYTWSYDGGANSNQPKSVVSRCTLSTNKTSCVGAAKLTETITYDALMRPIEKLTTDVASATSVYKNFTYDNHGNRTFSSFLSSSTGETEGITYSYDELQRLSSEVVSNGGTQTTSYLPGNKIKVNNFNNYDTTTTYLAYGYPSYKQATNIISPEGVTTSLSVNVFGEVESITQSGAHKAATISQTQTNLYNSAHQLCMVKRNDVGNTYYQYNNIGEITWYAQGVSGSTCTAHNATNLQKVALGYDNLGAKQSITYGDSSPDVTYTLDNNGDIDSLVAGNVTQTYDYNSARLLKWETLAVDNKSFKLDYAYDSLGALSSLTYPDAAVGQVDFAPNAFGQATKATRTSNSVTTKYATGASYYANGLLDTFTYGNGLTHKTTLNSRNLPLQIRDYKNSTNHVKLGYTYDNQNNIETVTDGINSAYSLTDLTYDGLDRLTSTTGGSAIGSSAISYDAVGNITAYSNTSSSKASALTYAYNLTSNRLTNVTGNGSAGYDFNQASSYDTRGNVTNNGMRTFDYNLANQMTNSGTNSYVYDGYNRRVKTTDSKGISYSMYSQSGRLLYREVDDSPTNYIFLGGKLVAKDGELPAAPDSRMHYKPFGDSIEMAKDEVGYTGHKFDTDLGLSYMQARYYDPVIGRFYSNDPVGFTGNPHSFNRYAYVHNNPYKYTDPNGEYPESLAEWGNFASSSLGLAASAGEMVFGGALFLVGGAETLTGVAAPIGVLKMAGGGLLFADGQSQAKDSAKNMAAAWNNKSDTDSVKVTGVLESTAQKLGGSAETQNLASAGDKVLGAVTGKYGKDAAEAIVHTATTKTINAVNSAKSAEDTYKATMKRIEEQ